MGKEIQKWADEAMFAAEPLKAAEGPKVYLLWMTPDPLGAIAAACKMYKGEVVRNLADVTDDERIEYLAQIQKTKLKAPFEFVKFHFLIEGVTRAFTHQLVRQRTAVYAQESLRFAVKENMAESVALPPSLAGTDGAEKKEARDRSKEDQWRASWDTAMDKVGGIYQDLVDAGMPAEDARGLLPHNITTRVHYSTDLRALLDHAGNRLCTQAQFEWRAVFARIIEAIDNAGGIPPGHENGSNKVYFGGRLSELFRPVCYQTGKCEFKANFDRKCKIRERVDAFEDAGVKSEHWERPSMELFKGLLPISPVEWIADPSAAR